MFLNCASVNILNYFKDAIVSKISEFLGENLDDSLLCKLIVAPPTDDKHGDLYTNAALLIGKIRKRNPLEIAGSLSKVFSSIEGVESVEIAAPGFINLKCTQVVWGNVIKGINKLGKEYGKTNLGNGRRVNLEFVSANPTGPLHVGHARGAVFGDVLANILEWVGYQVTREYYINDAGSQINKLVESLYLRYREVLGERVTIGDGLYPGEYLKTVAQEMFDKYGHELQDMEGKEEIIREFALESILNLIKADLALMGIKHDVFTSEAELQRGDVVGKCIEFLKEKGIIYYGTLEKPKGGSEEIDWQPRVQMLFKSTDFGDDSDRALQKEDGSWSYFASDIAYHFDKISRGFDYMILGLGFDHKGYASRLKAAVKAMSSGKATIDIKFHSMVNFLENGMPIKMSKRKGEFLTIRDVIEEVGKDVTRFMMLTRKNDVVLDFDFVKAVEQSKDSQIFYIQYAHARAHSLMQNFPQLSDIDEVDFSVICSEPEITLVKLLARWPSIVEFTAKNHEPHRIAFYLMEVAEAFHVLWGYGNRDAGMRFIVAGDDRTTSARIYLVKAVATVISVGLALFSIDAIQEMR